MRKNVIKRIIHIIVLCLISTMIAGAIYLINYLSSTHFDQVIFCLFSSNTGNTDFNTIFVPLKICLPIIIVLTLVFYALFYGFSCARADGKSKILNYFSKHRVIYTIILFILSLLLLGYSVRFFEYLNNIFTSSNFIEQNYTNPKETTVSFSKKNNLILIFVESLENTLFSKEHGGNWNYEVIPELYDLCIADNSISFNASNGMKMLHGSSWTSASVVANNTGVPFKVGFNRNVYDSNFMSGAYALGDLLKDNGYYNEVISGASTSFGNLDKFYKQHGDYTIVDIDSLNNYGLGYDKTDIGSWGLNDKCLFNIAKERLNTISKKDEPFNLQLITIDTHFFDGFIGDYSENKFESQYENAYATESKLINEFVKWVKEQPFYNNTTIVIIGDHLTMQSTFINNKMFNNRSIYSCIINPSNKASISKDRIYTALDTYPTIVSAVGGKINGEKLGLGVNLFSNEQTLVEKYGLQTLDKELEKSSNFYNNKILSNK